jgi:NDP-sugar pyrophosphorylase family protein
MKAVILAGGKGISLAPYTKIIPKPLVPIGDMPILEVMLYQLKQVGVDEVILAIDHLGYLLQAAFGDGSRYGLRICYSMEDRPLGTAGALALIKGLDETFLVANGDTLTTLGFSDLLQHHRLQEAAVTIAMCKRKVDINFGIPQLNSNNEVVGYVEKPFYDFQVSMGIYIFEPRVLNYIVSGQYLDFPTLVLKLLKAKERVVGYLFDGYWKDLGRADDYEQAIKDFDIMRTEFLGEGEK